MSESNRRDFLKTGAVLAATAAGASAVHAAGNDVIKVGLIGCGGRGSGAVRDCLSADKSVKVVALGDAFENRLKSVAGGIKNQFKDRVDLGDRMFVGLDAYRKVIDSGVDLVLLATPPGFRPLHLEAAITAGKHVFTEKPVAVDGPGIRKCLELAKLSKEKNLAVMAGTQRRHQKSYNEVYKRIQDGLIGEIVGGRCSWNNNGIWFNSRAKLEKDLKAKLTSDAEYQLRNWYHFLYLCGDHIVEQHVHNIDVINWFTGKHPTRAVGMGGRTPGNEANRPAGVAKDAGHIWDHFAVEFDYGGGMKVASYCRHYPGPGDVSEMVIGTKGAIRTDDKNYYELVVNGKVTELYDPEKDKKDTNPYVQEHIDLIQSIKAGKPANELEQVAHSTLSAILGREAAYSGRSLKWEDMLNSKRSLMPADFTLASNPDVDPTPVPGKYKFA